MTPLRAVISDFGGVLTSPLAGAFAHFQDHAGLSAGALGRALDRVTEREDRNPLFELECGRLSEADFLTGLSAALEEELGRPVPMHEFTERYWARLVPNEPMLAFIGTLRRTGWRTALLTNNVREWEPRWRAMFPVDELFEVVVDSAFVGIRKPDQRIYALTAERLGIAPAACLFVDDVAVNCDAARELGMTAVHFADTERALAEMRSVLGVAAA